MHRDRVPERCVVRAGTLLVLAGTVHLVAAQLPPDGERGPIRVEVTGSNIPRVDSEAALPVQAITRDDIVRSGAATTPELMSRVSANILGFNDQLSLIGSFFPNQPGLASANLRGIGDRSTLVLLDGRRIANYAFNGGTVDLNAIPLSAIERVEILKDGASAIYGTDAIAGVVNFILRKDFHGLEAAGEGAWTQQGGADAYTASVTAGHGDLSSDGFNIFATVGHRREDALHAADRPFSRTGYIPQEGVIQLSGASFPASIQARAGTPPSLINPAFPNGCAPPTLIPVAIPNLSRTPFCGYDFTSAIDILPQAERTSVVARATFQVGVDHQLFAEANYADNRFLFRDSPTSVFQGALSNPQPVLYPAEGPYYPATFAAANGLSGDLNLRLRTTQLGPQTNATQTQAMRFVGGANGTIRGWSYAAALTYSENRQTDTFVSGYVSQQLLIPALASGLINPFGPSAPAGDALLASTQITGTAHEGRGKTIDFDFKASRELYELAAGPLAIAMGAEARHEYLENRFEPVWTSGDVVGVGGNQQSAEGARSVQALFVEASVPIIRGLEAQLASRYDHYSDFGGTTNPKIALRWQPVRSLLLRTSWGTGFRAPALYDLFTPLTRRGTTEALQDPLRCPVTNLPTDCGDFIITTGGNPALQPEASQQFNAGVVWQALTRLTLGIDYWKINKSNVIGTLDPATVFAQFDRFGSSNIVRGAFDPKFPGLPGAIETVLVTTQNLGSLRTSGFDASLKWRSDSSPLGTFAFGLDGTYVTAWSQQLDGVHYTSALGRKGLGIAGPVPRWKHYASMDWQLGAWEATLAQTYQSGYLDANIDRGGFALPISPRSVGAYEFWDVQGRYSGFRNVAVALGVKNLMDRAPPFSNQPFTRQVGFDPVYADPHGRTFYARVTLSFR